jgi:hypothetical protein
MSVAWISVTDAAKEVRCDRSELARLADTEKIQALVLFENKRVIRWVPRTLIDAALSAGHIADRFANYATEWCEQNLAPLPYGTY